MTPLRLRDAVAAGAALLVLGVAPAAARNDGFVIELPELRNFVAAAAGAVPDYLGSNDYTVGVAPAGFLKFGASERYVRLVALDVNVNLIDDKQWAFGPAVNYRLARDDVDDAQVKLMRDIDGTFEAGVFGGWNWIAEDDPRHRLSLGAEFLHDVGGAYDGYLVAGSVRYFRPVSRPLTLSIGTTLTYGSDGYTETYFGVDAVDSARSGLAQYNADGGLRDVRFPMLAIFSFSPNWHLSGGMIYSRMLGDAADSPVTSERGSKNNYYVGAGIAYAW